MDGDDDLARGYLRFGLWSFLAFLAVWGLLAVLSIQDALAFAALAEFLIAPWLYLLVRPGRRSRKG